MLDISSAPLIRRRDFLTHESKGSYRRLELLREQLPRENRRSAAPFAHPLAAHGPLWTLREQIRDVSRIADAVAINADSASESRLTELCSDLRRLLQTQQRWTERLENQIWRLESQASLMKRLQQALLHGSPGADQVWELCELIARETLAVPDGLLLLPEPGHRLALASEGLNHFTANSIEQARLTVFAAMSILPDVRGADLVAGMFRFEAEKIIQAVHEGRTNEPVNCLRQFADQLVLATPAKELTADSRRLLEAAAHLAIQIDQRSLTAADCLVPPPLLEFYRPLVQASEWFPHADEDGLSRIQAMCRALGLLPTASSEAAAKTEPVDEQLHDGDSQLVLIHKLRWHDGQQRQTPASEAQCSDQQGSKSGGRRLRRPHFLRPSSEIPKFSVFAE